MNTQNELSNYLNGVPSMDANTAIPSNLNGGGHQLAVSGSGSGKAAAASQMSDWEKHKRRFHHGQEPEPGHCSLKDQMDRKGGGETASTQQKPSSGMSGEAAKSYLESVNGQKESWSDMNREDFLNPSHHEGFGTPGSYAKTGLPWKNDSMYKPWSPESIGLVKQETKQKNLKQDRRKNWLDQCKPGTRLSSRSNTYVKGKDGKWYVEDSVWDDDGEHLRKTFLRPHRGFPLSAMSFVDKYIPDDFKSDEEDTQTSEHSDPYAKYGWSSIPKGASNYNLGGITVEGWVRSFKPNGESNRGWIPHFEAVSAAQSLFPDTIECSFENVKDDDTGRTKGQNMFIRKEDGVGYFGEGDADDILAKVKEKYPDAEIIGDDEGDQIQIFLPNKQTSMRIDSMSDSASLKYKTSSIPFKGLT